MAKLDECLGRLQDEVFAEHIRTDDQSVSRVADIIARSAGLTIDPDGEGIVRAQLRLYADRLRRIRRD